MIAFSLISLRRMKKISVMDAIHGENRGERFSRIPGVSLNSTKKISVPTFLAVQDIVRNAISPVCTILPPPEVDAPQTQAAEQ